MPAKVQLEVSAFRIDSGALTTIVVESIAMVLPNHFHLVVSGARTLATNCCACAAPAPSSGITSERLETSARSQIRLNRLIVDLPRRMSRTVHRRTLRRYPKIDGRS